MSSLLEFLDFETLIFEILVIELVKVEIFRFLSQNLPCKWRVVFIGKILGWDTKVAISATLVFSVNMMFVRFTDRV